MAWCGTVFFFSDFVICSGKSNLVSHCIKPCLVFGQKTTTKWLLVCPPAIFANSIWFRYRHFTFQPFFWISWLLCVFWVLNACFLSFMHSCLENLKQAINQAQSSDMVWGLGFQTVVGSVFVNMLIAGECTLAIRRYKHQTCVQSAAKDQCGYLDFCLMFVHLPGKMLAIVHILLCCSGISEENTSLIIKRKFVCGTFAT